MNRCKKQVNTVMAAVTYGFMLLICAVSGCMSLDPFLFKGEELTVYSFDEYNGKTECTDALDSLGPVDRSTLHEVSFESGPATIAAVLLAQTTMFDSTDTLILYIHGTGPHLDYYWPRTRLLAGTGYPVFAFDFRGYGKSTGTPTEDGIYQDGFCALRHIRENYGNPRIVVYAFSLGSLVGCEIASKDTGGSIIALILEAPIGQVATLVEDASYLDLPASYVTTYKGKNVEKIRNVQVPLLWLHGTDDETLALETNGKQVYRNYRGGQGYYLIVQSAGHQTIPSVIGYDRYRARIADFIGGRAAQNPFFSTKLE